MGIRQVNEWCGDGADRRNEIDPTS